MARTDPSLRAGPPARAVGEPARPVRVAQGPRPGPRGLAGQSRAREREEAILHRAERPQMALAQVISANCQDSSRRTSHQALNYVLKWDVMSRLGTPNPSANDLADFWGESVRTIYRWQAAFRAAFPGEVAPRRVLRACDRARDQRTGLRGLAEALVFVEVEEEAEEQVSAESWAPRAQPADKTAS